MALDIGSIMASLSLDSAPYKRGMLEANAVTSTFGQTITTGLVNPVLGALGAMKQFAGAAAAASDRLLSMAESVQRTSDLTGVSVETIQSLRHALADMGLSAEGADAAMTAFNRKLGDAKKDGGATAASLRQLGVDITNVGSGEAAMRRVFDQLSRIQDVGQRAAAAAEIFDRQFGPQLLAAIEGGSAGIDALNARMIATGRTLDRSVIAKMVQLDDRVDKLKGNLQGLETTLTSEFLMGIADGIGATDTSSQKFAATLRDELGPAARGLGRTMGEAVEALRALIGLIGELDAMLGGKNARTPRGTETRFPFVTSSYEALFDFYYGNYAGSRDLYGVSLNDMVRRRARPERGR